MSNRNQGFTLIELVTTLTIVAVVISIAVPALSELIARERQHALLTELWTAVQNARAIAVVQAETIELCGTNDAANCTSDWTNGWLVQRPASQQVLNATLIPTIDQLRWKGLGKSIRFRSNGTTVNNGTFYQCHRQKVAWQLKLSRQGRLRLTTQAENKQDNMLCTE